MLTLILALSGAFFPAARGSDEGGGTFGAFGVEGAGGDSASGAGLTTAAPDQLLPDTAAWHAAPWLRDLAEYPEVQQRRGEIYNRIFRYRGALENVHDAYALWFDCLFARALPPLGHGPALTAEGGKFCGRLGHRIAREQRARLAPMHDATDAGQSAQKQGQRHTAQRKNAAFVVDTTPSRDAFLDLYSQQAAPLLLRGLAADMVTDTQSALEACLQTSTVAAAKAAEVDDDGSEGEWSIHDKCMNFLRDHFHIPEFASEDVLQIMDSKLHAVSAASGTSAAASADYTTAETPPAKEAASPDTSEPRPQRLAALATQWPTLWRADGISHHGCNHGPTQAPGGAHVLIMPLRGDGLTVRIYGPHRHHAFHRIVTVGGRRLYSAAAGADTYDTDDEAEPIRLVYPDVIFIPSGSIYSWSCAPRAAKKGGVQEEEAATSAPTVVLTHGFVDAGALTHFINELTLDAAQDPDAYGDEVMDMVLGMYGAGAPFKRTTAASQKSGAASTVLLPWGEFKRGGASARTAAAGNGDTLVKKHRKSAHKEWRMQKLWERKLLSVVPPQPVNVRVLYTGWELVQLEIDLPFGPSSTFASVHNGFVLSWSLLNNDTTIHSLNATGSHKMNLQDHCHAKTNKKEGIDNSTTYICTCRVLRTASVYALRVAVLTTSSVGPNSEPVATKTQALSVPPAMPAPTLCGIGLRKVPQGTPTTLPSTPHTAHTDMRSLYACLEVLPPVDNGGKVIEELLFRWRRSGKHHTYTHDPFVFHIGSNETMVVNHLGHPARMTKNVHNIIPNATLLFSVATRSSVGMSAWSPELEVNTHVLESKEGPITVHAPLVDFDYRDPIDPLEEDRNRTVRTVHQNTEGPVVIMSKMRHSVTLVDPEGTRTNHIDAWGLHFAPSSHDVRGMLVIAEPLDAHGPLVNAEQVRGNIVLIERGGGYPFRDKVMHAQRAGAIGVIFMDHGQCSATWTQGCVPGASKHNGEGFALQDAAWAWEGLDTPAVIVNKEHGEFLISEMAAPLM